MTMRKCIVENVLSLDSNKMVAACKDQSFSGIRTWIDIDWRNPLGAGQMDVFRKYADAGLPICACFTTKMPPSLNSGASWDAVSKYFEVTRSRNRGGIEFWEIGNEPNLSKYWSLSLEKFVDLVGEPAAAALKGEKTISGSISKSLVDLKKVKDLGLLQKYTYVGYHPYGYTVKEHCDNMSGACAIAAPQQLVATEWNMHGATPSGWAVNIGKMWEADKKLPLVHACYYYRGLKGGEFAGKAGIWKDKTYAHAEPFWTAVDKLS